MRRRTGLTALFWRYLLVTGGAVVLLAVLWWGGLVRPAPQRLCPPGGHRRPGRRTGWSAPWRPGS